MNYQDGNITWDANLKNFYLIIEEKYLILVIPVSILNFTVDKLQNRMRNFSLKLFLMAKAVHSNEF